MLNVDGIFVGTNRIEVSAMDIELSKNKATTVLTQS